MAAVSVTPTEHTSNKRLETHTLNERITMLGTKIGVFGANIIEKLEDQNKEFQEYVKKTNSTTDEIMQKMKVMIAEDKKYFERAAEDSKEYWASTNRIEENIKRSNEIRSDIENIIDAKAASGENFKKTSKERSTTKNDLTDERQTIQDSTNELSKFNIKTVVSDKTKSYTEPDKKHSKLVPSQEPVQEKVKNKRKRQSTLCEEAYELIIQIFGIDKFNCQKGMTESQKKDSIQLIKYGYQYTHKKRNFKSYKTLGTNRLKEISNFKFKDTRSRHRKLIAVKKRMLRYTI